MENVKAIVLRAAGVNCDLEKQYALELAGAQADRIHINRIIERPDTLDSYQILVLPGGFSYGDDVAAGKILANQRVAYLATARGFIGRQVGAGHLQRLPVLIKRLVRALAP